jgi:hypothetical protein
MSKWQSLLAGIRDRLSAIVAIGVFLVGMAALAIAGCTNPFIQTTTFDWDMTSRGTIAWSIQATGGANAWGVTITRPVMAIRNLQGPPIYVEGYYTWLFSNNDDSLATYSFPIKASVAGVVSAAGGGGGGGGGGSTGGNLTWSIGEPVSIFGFIQATRPPGNLVVPAGTTLGLGSVVLWRNSVGQSNFRGGTRFDSACFCYPAVIDPDTGLPTFAQNTGINFVTGATFSTQVVIREDPVPLRTNGIFPEVNLDQNGIEWDVTYRVGGGA